MKSINETILKKFKNSFLFEENEFVDNLFTKRGVKFTKNSNGEYDIDGGFVLGYFPELIADGKLNIKFGKVSGDFWCHDFKNLKSLEGCPKEVGGDFDCSKCNSLTSLKGAPEKVGGDFNCRECENLTSLEGAPEKVGGQFDCSFCENLTSLKGAPKKVVGNFSCTSCDNLTSLEGIPEKVSGDFCCNDCGIVFAKDDIRNHCNVLGAIIVSVK